MATAQVKTAVRDESFATTHWSVVLAARDPASSQSRQALEKLCRAYWEPLHGYVRRRGYTEEDAKDLTQEFFVRLSAPEFLASVSSEKGKFRSFLLASLNHFLANEWHRAHTQKRGGNIPHLSLEAEVEKTGELQGPASVETPEMLFDKRWALTILERALAALRQEFISSGKLPHFDTLKPYLTDSSTGADYDRAAALLQMKPDTVAVTVHRLRKRYRELVRAEVAQTVESEADLEAEMSYLLAVLSR